MLFGDQGGIPENQGNEILKEACLLRFSRQYHFAEDCRCMLPAGPFITCCVCGFSPDANRIHPTLEAAMDEFRRVFRGEQRRPAEAPTDGDVNLLYDQFRQNFLL